MAENWGLTHWHWHRLRQLMTQMPFVEAVKICHSLLHIYNKPWAGNSHVYVYYGVLQCLPKVAH